MLGKIRIAGFDWDHGNHDKCHKHGVSRAEIERLFQQNPVSLAPDDRHSSALEQRYIATGCLPSGRRVFVAFALKESPDGLLIRPISARYMHDKEFRRYAQENPPADNR
jgi:uncharacterized protein